MAKSCGCGGGSGARGTGGGYVISVPGGENKEFRSEIAANAFVAATAGAQIISSPPPAGG